LRLPTSPTAMPGLVAGCKISQLPRRLAVSIGSAKPTRVPALADRRLRTVPRRRIAAGTSWGKNDGRSGPPDQAERGCKVAASTEIGPMGPVRQFVEGFNGNDVELAQAACMDETTIIDDLPPHEWSGPLATTSWLRDMARVAADYGMSGWSLTLGEPRHVIVSDGHAYVVVPADVRWLQDGTPAERACLMTMALRQNADGWLISSLAWTWG
jgi:hypothetical protein